MYTVHNTTHTVHCTYKINHVKDKYMHTIQCTMYIQSARYPASFIKCVNKMASSYKTVHYILPLQSASLYCSSRIKLGAAV